MINRVNQFAMDSGEQRLIDYQKKISNILESFTDGFFEVDADWTVIYWNKEAERLLDKPREEIIGQNLWQAYQDAIPLKFYTEYHKALEQNISVRFEEYFPPFDLWVEVAAFPTGSGLSVYFKDITDRVRHMKAIEEQNRRLSEISWIQSHKVRAPLSRILGLAELLNAEHADSKEQKQIGFYIYEAAKELDKIVEEIVRKT